MEKWEWHDKVLRRVEELILIFIILLSVMDFFGFLPADMGYAKKIISWTLMGYLLYKASPTKIFFNNKKPHIDLILIVSYFLLIFKNMIVVAALNIEESDIFRGLYEILLQNAGLLETSAFHIGIGLLMVISIYCAIMLPIKKPSLMHLIHEEGNPSKNIAKSLVRIAAIFSVFLAFFLVVFNLIMEWLAVAIDAPMIIIGISFYLFIVIRHYKKFDVESLIFRIGEFGESFYKKFISLFHYKKTIYLGISGMLVLHLLTDIGNFILPYVTVFHENLYFQMGAGHTALIPLLREQIQHLVPLEKASLVFIYILNVAAILFLLAAPAFLWYKVFKSSYIRINKPILSLFFSSLFAFVFAPVFEIKKISTAGLIGIDIITKPANNLFFPSFFSLLLFCAAVYFIIFYLSGYSKKLLVLSSILTSLLFFGVYVYLFFISVFEYYTASIIGLLRQSEYLLIIYFAMFLMILLIFYAGGFFLWIYELIKIRISEKIV